MRCAASAINAAAGYNACSPTGCTPVQAASLDNIYNYPGDKAVQKARPFPNYSQILEPEHNTYANYNGLLASLTPTRPIAAHQQEQDEAYLAKNAGWRKAGARGGAAVKRAAQ